MPKHIVNGADIAHPIIDDYDIMFHLSGSFRYLRIFAGFPATTA
jgi:hypothetical protein